MKTIIFAFAFCLSFGQAALAQEAFSTEGDQTLTIYDTPTQSLSKEPLDSEGLLVKPPTGGGGVHPAPPQHPPSHPNPPSHPPTHPNPPHPNPPHPNPHPPTHPNPHPNPHPHPGGWHWTHDWHPGWWHVGIIFPPWIWIDVPAGYWQCTAFNQNMQAFSEAGTDMDDAAYNALYACGGPDFQQFGCYVPEGYCQHR